MLNKIPTPKSGKVIAVIQARMDSSRLPGKSLMNLSGKPVLQWCVNALKDVNGIDGTVVATSIEGNDDPIHEYCDANNINVYRGSKDNVLERMIEAAKEHEAKTVVRITADCPLLDPRIIESVVYLHNSEECDYASNADPATWPDGLDCEVISLNALEESLKHATSSNEMEHVTSYILANFKKFKIRNLSCPIPKLNNERWTLDDEDDYKFITAITEHLNNNTPPSYIDILNILKSNPELYSLKSSAFRNSGSIGIKDNQPLSPKNKHFSVSKKTLETAEKTIPLGSQTFSKSKINFPPGVSPLFLTHGRGSHVWDVDGNEYIDYIAGLLPISLGYCDPDVDYAIRTQMDRGISFSLATELEAELAEKLVKHVPCAEMVRFGKNGTDATSAAIRLARAHTGRDHVIACGYHGWQDWYIGSTTRNLGVPSAVSKLTHRVPHNNIDMMKEAIVSHEGKVAAIILEAASGEEPHKGYLEDLRSLCDEEGIVLIFDEIIMGFRQAIGGSQAYYGVTPDLACFGKGMANGMPLSAIVGKEKIMTLMNDIFYSGTFGGEALSLAASIATIDKMVQEDAINHMYHIGQSLADNVTALIARYELSHIFKLIGIAPWKIMVVNGTDKIDDSIIQTRFLTEMFKCGILTGGSHNICYAHSQDDVNHTIKAYDYVLSLIQKEINNNTITQNLTVDPIKPIFKVRG